MSNKLNRKLRAVPKPAAAPPPRAVDVIQKEYQEVCAAAGQMEYQARVLQAQLSGGLLHGPYKRLFELNQENAAAQAAIAAAEKAKAAPAEA